MNSNYCIPMIADNPLDNFLRPNSQIDLLTLFSSIYLPNLLTSPSKSADNFWIKCEYPHLYPQLGAFLPPISIKWGHLSNSSRKTKSPETPYLKAFRGSTVGAANRI